MVSPNGAKNITLNSIINFCISFFLINWNWWANQWASKGCERSKIDIDVIYCSTSLHAWLWLVPNLNLQIYMHVFSEKYINFYVPTLIVFIIQVKSSLFPQRTNHIRQADRSQLAGIFFCDELALTCSSFSISCWPSS